MNENFDFVSHKEKNPEKKKTQLSDRGKGLINTPKEKHDKMTIEGLQKGGEGYRSLNDKPLKEINILKEGKGSIRENENERVDETRESEAERKKDEKIEESQRVKEFKNEVKLV